jgi:hypothetical protein
MRCTLTIECPKMLPWPYGWPYPTLAQHVREASVPMPAWSGANIAGQSRQMGPGHFLYNDHDLDIVLRRLHHSLLAEEDRKARPTR